MKNGGFLLNNACKTLYSNNDRGAIARSINIEDIQNKMDLSKWDYRSYYTYGKVVSVGTTNRNVPYQWKYDKRNNRREK